WRRDMSNSSRMFPKQFLIDMLEEETYLEDTIVDTSRWSLIHRMIFVYEGKLYSSYYSVGKTESQDESPYENEDDEVVCRPVNEELIVRKDYSFVKDNEHKKYSERDLENYEVVEKEELEELRENNS